LRDLLEQGWGGREIRYVLINGHYRQPLNFTFTALEAARAALARVDGCVDALSELAGAAAAGAAPATVKKTLEEFTAAVNDDLGIPEAFAALFALVRESNSLMSRQNLTPAAAAATLDIFDRMDSVLGVVSFGRPDKDVSLPAEVATLLDERAAARAAKDWSGSDRIRDRLAAMGWEVRDSKEGQKVRKAP